jgi:hypothetical protein
VIVLPTAERFSAIYFLRHPSFYDMKVGFRHRLRHPRAGGGPEGFDDKVFAAIAQLSVCRTFEAASGPRPICGP